LRDRFRRLQRLWWPPGGSKNIEQLPLFRPLRSQTRCQVISDKLGGSGVQLLAFRGHGRQLSMIDMPQCGISSQG
jgi:hypothetical protein